MVMYINLEAKEVQGFYFILPLGWKFFALDSWSPIFLQKNKAVAICNSLTDYKLTTPPKPKNHPKHQTRYH